MTKPCGNRQVWVAGLLLLALGTACPAGAEEASKPLPEPLTLDYALSQVDSGHPLLEEARGDLRLSEAEVRAAEARTGVNLSIEGRAQWVDPADIVADDSHNDSKLGLLVRKNLYDFGRTSARRAAAEAQVKGSQWRYEEASDAQRIEIMRRFFDVLLADLEYARDNEAMAVAYVDLDKLRARNKLGQLSDVDLAKAESEYQRTRHQRFVSQNRQRATRARLALALNRPGMLPGNLVPPELPQVKRAVPPYERLLEKAVADNPRLHALRAEVAAARERLDAAQADKRPRLDAEMEGATYGREMGSHDKWRAGILFQVPLYSGGSVASEVARQQAELYKAQAQLRTARYDVRQAVLDVWLQLDNLHVEQDAVKALRDYRELYLDRSRAIYEMEVKTDLGDSMVRLTEAQLAAARTNFDIALAWERLDALTGGRLPPGGGEEKGK
jgi:outer membrane protein TolC